MKDDKGNVIGTRSGVSGTLDVTVKADGKPLPGVQVTEKNDTTVTVNGNEQPQGSKATGAGTTDSNGQVLDTVGAWSKTGGTKQDNDKIEKSYDSNVVTMTDKQTITLTLPGGSTCVATTTRTLTNADKDGKASGKYDLKTTPTVVKQPDK